MTTRAPAVLRPRRRAVLALVTINPATSDTTPYQILRAQGAWHFCRPRQKPPCPHRRACGAPLQTSARAHIRLPPRPDLPQLPQAWVAGKEPLHGARRPPAVSLATRMKRMVSQTSGSSPSSRARRPTTARPSTSCGADDNGKAYEKGQEEDTWEPAEHVAHLEAYTAAAAAAAAAAATAAAAAAAAVATAPVAAADTPTPHPVPCTPYPHPPCPCHRCRCRCRRR